MTSTDERCRSLCRQLLAEFAPEASHPAAFLGRQFDLGLAWVHFPVGLGGLGVSRGSQRLVDEILVAAGAPSAFSSNFVGCGMGAPTLLAHGSSEQKARYLRPLFIGEEVWCQLFSEPGAGSDIAGLAMDARRDGDHWVVNGQKVWTSLAHRARRGMLVVRTNSEVPKHQGLTYFVVDMNTPGIEVRPLYQMTGEAEFNEVFFTDVRVPDIERLSEVGDGWRVVVTTLMNERVSIGGGATRRGDGFIAEAIEVWKGLDSCDPARR